MIKQLKDEEKKWKSRGCGKKAFAAMILGAFAGALALAGVIVLACGISAATSGTAAPAAAVAAIKTCSIGGVMITQKCAIAAGVLGFGAVSMMAFAALSAPQYCSLAVLKKANLIQDTLQQMIQ